MLVGTSEESKTIIERADVGGRLLAESFLFERLDCDSL